MTSRRESFGSALFRHRDRLVGAWGLVAIAASWPPRSWLPSAVPLVLGLLLRLWARAHIGPHSRGRILSSPERCTGGPYRFLSHPLYAANLLVLLGLASALVGPDAAVLAILSGPTVLYILLGRVESRRLRELDPPIRNHPLPRAERKLRSEWASLVPPVVLWLLFQFPPR